VRRFSRALMRRSFGLMSSAVYAGCKVGQSTETWTASARRSSAAWSAGLLAAALVGALPRLAHAQANPDPVVVCLSEHTQGQELRRDGKLLESRDSFKQCSATVCPSEVIRDCLGWKEQVDQQIPSLGFRVTADGAPRADVRVFIDDRLAAEALDGKAIELNPGSHRVRIELAPFAPFDETFVVIEGDKFRMVDAKFTTPVLAPQAVVAAPAPPEAEMHRPIPVSSYVFAGVSVAAAINAAGWGLSMSSLRSELQDDCQPNCSPKSVDVLQQRALIADISWGVSLVSLATAVTLYVLRPEEPLGDSVALDLHIVPGGGAVGSLSVNAF
jgi:hypothetical protein